MKKKYKKILRTSLIAIVTLFILMNILIAMHSYSFTHFNPQLETTESDSSSVFTSEKISNAVFGLDIPKPSTRTLPKKPYKPLDIKVNENDKLDAWMMFSDHARKGIVVFFHGYTDEKSSMLDRAYEILDMGYDVILVDFMGAGGSYGTQTTIGYYEAENVKTTYDYIIHEFNEDNIYLFGFSMGAVAVIKAQYDYDMVVDGLILEAPYGDFFETISVRLNKMNVPRYPFTHLFAFWGGIQNDFDAFEFKPQEYVRDIHVPVLLMCGEKDQYIPISETQLIYDNLPCEKKRLRFFPNSTHQSYLIKHSGEWKESVQDFFKCIEVDNVFFKIQEPI